jgi:DNA-directed RNA polymerase specialized sigma24 family protein
MDIKAYFKKVYTVAYMLTGEEKIAEEIAELAITNAAEQLNGNNEVSASKLQLTILELVKIFLEMPKLHSDDNIMCIQKALLTLKPLNRAVVIWKDVLGYQLSVNIPVLDCTYEELVRELVSGRRELKEYISHSGWFEATEKLIIQ